MRKTNKFLGSSMVALAVVACLSAPALAQDIDFGDDTSEWANDGECDDSRFEGEGMAAEFEDVDIGHDATDCRTAFEAGKITLAAGGEASSETIAAPQATADETASEEAPAATTPAEVDFGDDSSTWANDGECDDPRFAGTGMAEELEDADILKDATDCRTAFEAGTIALADETETANATAPSAIDFGDDSSEWAKDQECDDPRFTGSSMASELDEANIGRDATDCENAFNDGAISLIGEDGATVTNAAGTTAWLTALADRIDFGDDSGGWPRDGECDDPDFVGSGAVSAAYEGDRMKDATDCRAAFIAGTVTLKSAGANTAFDYGSDFSQWANDGECDDWRFTGSAMAKKLYSEDVQGDATDCRMLESEGLISIKPVFQPDYALNGPYDSSGVDFGNNSSSYANDNICDDPRFEGPGVATTLLDSDRLADAVDCRAAFEQGTIMLRNGEV